jgi:hypothetical protein
MKGREVVALAALDAAAAPPRREPRIHAAKRPFPAPRRSDAPRPRRFGRELPDDVGE